MAASRTRIYFVGMGLTGFNSLSLQALEILRLVEIIFVEKYTNFISQDTPEFWDEINQKLKPISRKDLEEDDQLFLEKIEGKTVALLIPGDPFIATTHNSFRVAATKKGYECRLIHNSSIVSVAISISGLSSYSFGRTVTCPFRGNKSEFPYRIIQQNKSINAHTLVLLDISSVDNRFLSVDEAISILFDLEKELKENVLSDESIVIGLAKIGYSEEIICAGSIDKVSKSFNWREIGPPQALIVCANTFHFAEKEALSVLWGTDPNQ
ncbi:MAG: diphthine synthase [Candidatus Hodarchaeales archaeon]